MFGYLLEKNLTDKWFIPLSNSLGGGSRYRGFFYALRPFFSALLREVFK